MSPNPDVPAEIDVEWDVDLWANRYPISYLAIYNREIQQDPAERLRGLWRWKSLNRAPYDIEDILPYLNDAGELCAAIEGTVADAPIHEVTSAFIELRDRLTATDGPLSQRSRSAVTPQFLLHIADSHGTYSGRFPILDVMVARAHRVHTATNEAQTLQGTLTCSRHSYQQLLQYFFDRCETANQVAKLERALFVQGRSIGRYREDEGRYKNMRKVPVRVAREYLDEIVRYA